MVLLKQQRSILLTFVMFIFAALYTSAQIVIPVKWDIKFNKLSDKQAEVTFSAKIDAGWHLYGLDIPEDGPNPTSVEWTELTGVELDGGLTPDRAPHSEEDEMFGMTLTWWTNTVILTQKLTITDPNYIQVKGGINYNACNDEACIPPQTDRFKFTEGAPKASPASAEQTAMQTPNQPVIAPVEAEQVPTEVTDSAVVAPIQAANSDDEIDLWKPVIDQLAPDASAAVVQSGSLLYIFIAGFLGGLLALLTPCVWPLIPMTVSFFLKKSGSRARSIRDATVYGISIIVIYLLLGLIITFIFGASKLNELSTNAVFNIAFFLLLVVFAVSFFGAFDIKLPSSWSNKMDSTAEKTTGYVSIFFMAFTLALVSFSCTGPIIGTLLVEAATMGNITGPAIGMFGFALALAIPFSLFAIFPSVLKSMPKSGGWLNTVKVVLGFLELALALKFLSVADLAYGWHILDREVFICLWVVIFALLGMYLLGKINFPHDEPSDKVGVLRFFLATISLSFALYLVPGLWGAPLKSVSAFVPPLYTQDFNLYEEGKFKIFNDYEEGMAYAKEHNKPVLMDFSGYGCVNCRKMEAAVFDNPRVRQLIESDFVLIELMVDDKTPLKEPITVQENGREIELYTIGDRWSYLQRHKFGANSQPFYSVIDEKGDVMSGPYAYDENIDKFVEFLTAGTDKFKE